MPVLKLFQYDRVPYVRQRFSVSTSTGRCLSDPCFFERFTFSSYLTKFSAIGYSPITELDQGSGVFLVH